MTDISVHVDDLRQMPRDARKACRTWATQPDLMGYAIVAVTLADESGQRGILTCYVRSEEDGTFLLLGGKVATYDVETRWSDPFPVHVLTHLG